MSTQKVTIKEVALSWATGSKPRDWGSPGDVSGLFREDAGITVAAADKEAKLRRAFRRVLLTISFLACAAGAGLGLEVGWGWGLLLTVTLILMPVLFWYAWVLFSVMVAAFRLASLDEEKRAGQ